VTVWTKWLTRVIFSDTDEPDERGWPVPNTPTAPAILVHPVHPWKLSVLVVATALADLIGAKPADTVRCRRPSDDLGTR
jgi:hypothetical protein